MKKRNLAILSTAILASLCLSAVSISIMGQEVVEATTDEYIVTFNVGCSKVEENIYIAYTQQNHPIYFYADSIFADGSMPFLNDEYHITNFTHFDDENHNQISGISSIIFAFEEYQDPTIDLQVAYYEDLEGDNPTWHDVSSLTTLVGDGSYLFEEHRPSYFKFSLIESFADLIEVIITYTCVVEPSPF